MDLLGIRLFFVDFILTTEQFAAISAWYVDQEVQLYVALGCFASPIECSFCHLTGGWPIVKIITIPIVTIASKVDTAIRA